MITQGQNASPVFVDIGKSVTQYIPNSIDAIFSNSQNSLVGLYDQSSSRAYFYRSYEEGQNIIMRGWYSWEMPGNVQFMQTDNDEVFTVTQQGTQLTLLTSQLNTIPTSTQVSSGSIKDSNPSFDFIADPLSARFINNETRIYIPFEVISGLTPVAVQDAASGSTFSGFFQTCTTGTDSEGTYFAIAGKDLSTLDWLVGYKLEFKVDMPYLFRRSGELVDTSAYLTINRIKFSLGLSGQCNFKITPNRQPQITFDATSMTSGQYEFDKVPIEDRIIFTVPVMQRNTNFGLQVSSDNPYVVSLTSAMWEGKYSDKHYTRL